MLAGLGFQLGCERPAEPEPLKAEKLPPEVASDPATATQMYQQQKTKSPRR